MALSDKSLLSFKKNCNIFIANLIIIIILIELILLKS